MKSVIIITLTAVGVCLLAQPPKAATYFWKGSPEGDAPYHQENLIKTSNNQRVGYCVYSRPNDEYSGAVLDKKIGQPFKVLSDLSKPSRRLLLKSSYELPPNSTVRARGYSWSAVLP